MLPPDARREVVGWDIGGAHVKACRMRDGHVVEVVQWACPLWQGTTHLERVLRLARARWRALGETPQAVTMTGEMTDLFEHREDGVGRIAALLGEVLDPNGTGLLRFYAGDDGWRGAGEVGAHWRGIASANWRATASHAARRCDEGVLIDIGSTTTDLVAFRGGRVLAGGRSDAERLAEGELVYQGVVRTPLCALGPRVAWRGRAVNVMNELFATTADVYRLTGELDPAHDLQPSADEAAKDLPSTRRRLARMIGLDARDAADDAWLAFARGWRERQVDELGGQLRRVVEAHGLSKAAVAMTAGCGDFLAADVIARAGAPLVRRRYASEVASIADAALPSADAAARWAQVAAPAVAVAALYERQLREGREALGEVDGLGERR